MIIYFSSTGNCKYIAEWIIGTMPYIFIFSTYGTTPGHSAKDAEKEIKNRSLVLSAAFSIKMSENWAPRFDLNNKEEVEDLLENADEELSQVIERIKKIG